MDDSHLKLWCIRFVITLSAEWWKIYTPENNNMMLLEQKHKAIKLSYKFSNRRGTIEHFVQRKSTNALKIQLLLQGVTIIGSIMHIWHPSVKGYNSNIVKDFLNNNDDNVVNCLMYVAGLHRVPLIGVKFRYQKLYRYLFKYEHMYRKRTADYQKIWRILHIIKDELMAKDEELENENDIIEEMCEMLTKKKNQGLNSINPIKKQ